MDNAKIRLSPNLQCVEAYVKPSGKRVGTDCSVEMGFLAVLQQQFA